MEDAPRKRVLILGGGFAGLTVAMELEKKLALDPSVEVTLVNRDNFFLFTPMLHEVAASDLDLTTTVAGINDFVRAALRSYPRLTEDMLRVILIHSGPTILPELDEKLGVYAQRKLAGRKVEVRLNAKVEGFSDRTVRLSDGTTIHTNTLVWTAGTSPSPLVETIPCTKERGRLLVTETLELQDWPGVWALGDCSAIPDRRTGRFCPPTAQHALREAKVVAHNVIATVRGKEKMRFDFSTIAQLAAIGRRTGVANILGINFSGFIAWWLWRTIYLSKLPRLEKKLRVAFDWTLDLIFSKDLVQFLDIRAPMVSRPEADSYEQSKTVAARIA
jgi:NADH:quinone reductase (non-electrogenic)